MDYDVIIVGSGAGGSAAAYHLVQIGMKVLLIERGPELPHDGSTLDVSKVLGQGLFKHDERWLDASGSPIAPTEFANLGGKTKWYGAALLRFAPREFAEEPTRQFMPWPIGYDELAPFYDEAERLLNVRTFDVEPDLQRIVRSLCNGKGRWQSRALPIGLSDKILEHTHEARHFDGFASALNLKSDAQVALLDRVRHRENLRVLTGTNVVALAAKSGAPSRVAGVVCDDGTTHSGAAVILAAGALNSPRLLGWYFERTGLSRHIPAHELIGRFYKCHLNTALMAFSARRKTDTLRKTVLLTHGGFLQSSVQNLGWMDGEIFRTQLPRVVPQWASELAGSRAYGFWLTTEDGSHRDNRVIDRSQGSAHPQLHYDPRRTPHSLREHLDLIRTLRGELLKMGYVSFVKRMPVEATAHACGTLVAGRDPRASVVDSNGRVHGIDNLYIADGSVFARSASVNPALTIYAWGLRVASELVVQRPVNEEIHRRAREAA